MYELFGTLRGYHCVHGITKARREGGFKRLLNVTDIVGVGSIARLSHAPPGGTGRNY